ncbi:hypothetical protein [Olleya sp. Bg11-27]|uniref:hypothetical protein n=1 Tax=Olleya sp. Bg11-27 TaxID=2058135 RepID=UPI000C31B394|nr:hypothetical protein [Olleya sp. Bg11-27]AUC76460.1 hypothetical protein CW732_12590 [Olleya sp. Bg11-27]
MKTIVIQSIGTAKPGITKILADAFEINHQLLTQMIYNAPSLFLHKVDEETAAKVKNMLTELGLEILVQKAEDAIPTPTEKLDLALYIQNPLKIQKIAKQLSDFIGINEKEAFELLIQDPSVVLGGVSQNTAFALDKRIDAEVMASNPRKATYTILVKDLTPSFINEFGLLCQNAGYTLDQNKIMGLTHKEAQQLWTKVQDPQKIKLVNEDFIRYRIILNAFDANNEVSVQFLNEQIGMPTELIGRLNDYLPLEIVESLSKCKVESYLELTTAATLDCESHVNSVDRYQLQIQNITQKEQVEKTLDLFFKTVDIKDTKWQTPEKLDSVLNRLLSEQLEALGCDVEPIYS